MVRVSSHPSTSEEGTIGKGRLPTQTDHLGNYIKRHKLNTIEKIIKRWAPSNENNTKQYIATVAELSKMDATTKININDKLQMYSLFMAMCFVENGQFIDLEVVGEGYHLAFDKNNTVVLPLD